jgi:eukaryotic-like serine/threonine-protein kinase
MDIQPLLHQTIAGKYRIESVVAEGTASVVLAGTVIPSGDRVAVKLLRERISAGARDRFLNEARATARLRNPHVAKFRDVGTLHDNTPYFVMELLEGTDLGRVLESTYEGVGVETAVDYVLQACEGIAEAHSHGIIHRDIKPANLFLARQPGDRLMIKVLDFGIAHAPAAVGAGRLTTEETVLGTPAFMSPEQMRSARQADARSDIWSLGAVLYQLIEGETPFDAESYADLCLTVAMDPPMPMEVPVPPGLARAIARCLEKDPARRFQSVGDFARTIVPYTHDVQQGWMRVVRIERMVQANPGAAIFAPEPAEPRALETIRIARTRAKTPRLRNRGNE